ncbi:MAG: hypothetical protein Q8S54_10270 [Bacteroidota bacterium]|nr:hypothetical protein [Odoribacter sp.]MDP3643559.1 hypothetical protein [Bacteroidota bacterium]
MFSSPNSNIDIVLAIYQDIRTIFRLNDIAMLTGETNFQSLSQKLNYHVRTGKVQNPRKGIYAKPAYNAEELACTIYTPSYISLEYVLQKAGIVFQFDSRISVVSYLSRSIEVENKTYFYRKMKGEILVNTAGIIRQNNQVNIATAERAFLDVLYLTAESYFDNLNPLNKDIVYKILPLYQSKTLTVRVNKLLPK